MIATIADNLDIPALLIATEFALLRLLPLVSDRVNARAVRLAKAKKKSK